MNFQRKINKYENSPHNHLNTKTSVIERDSLGNDSSRDANKYIQLRDVWEGRNRFWWYGKYIKGPKEDNKAKYWYWIVFIMVQMLYFLMVAPYVIRNISLLLFLFTTFMFLLTIVFSIITSVWDPGIIPRYAVLRAINNGIIPERYAKPILEMEANSLSSDKKFCKTWKIWRPERASHCPTWDCWVEVFDHHCPYLNNWIGKRNYKYFVAFLCWITLDGLSVIASLIIYATDDFSNHRNPTETSPLENSTVTRIVISLIGLVCILLMLLVLALCVFHIYLIFKGKTTKEELNHKTTTRTKRMYLACLSNYKPNFKGSEYLSKVQYEMYLAYRREVKEGRVRENADQRIMELFHKQRKMLQVRSIEEVNRQHRDPGLLMIGKAWGWDFLNFYCR